MKLLLSRFLGATVWGTDASVGAIRDWYFDDSSWTLRYLVCELPAGGDRRSVLIPSGFFGSREWDLPVFPIERTREQIELSPGVDSDMPVYRSKSYGYDGMQSWPDLGGMGNPTFHLNPAPSVRRKTDPHLRSFQEVRRYELCSEQGRLGRLQDFVVEEGRWNLCGVLVRLGPWGKKRRVVVSPHWIKSIDWSTATVWTDEDAVEWEATPSFAFRV